MFLFHRKKEGERFRLGFNFGFLKGRYIGFNIVIPVWLTSKKLLKDETERYPVLARRLTTFNLGCYMFWKGSGLVPIFGLDSYLTATGSSPTRKVMITSNEITYYE